MYETDLRSWLKHLDFIIGDLLSITVSFWVSFFIRNNMTYYGLAWESNYRGFYLIVLSFYILLAFLFRTYSNIVRRSYLEEIFAVFKQNIFLLGCILAYLVFTKQSGLYSRLFLGYFIILNIVSMSSVRIIWKYIIRKRLQASDGVTHVLLVTHSRLAEECIKRIKDKDYQSFQISGLVMLDREDRKEICNIPIVSTLDEMLEYIRLNVVDQVLFHIEEFPESWKDIVTQLIDMGVVVHVSFEQFDRFPHKSINQIGNMSVITTSFQTASMEDLFLKRAMDIMGSIIGLLITGIVFIFVAPMIYIKSPGPVFFSQERIGRNGRKFRIYKFRSMYLDAEKRKKELMERNQMQGLMFKMDDDPRIIKGIGHFIRNTSIDELPQFWNILKGDMSLVGTRPPTVDEFEQYNYHHKIRLSFKPGLTGMWQVSGRSDITDFEEVVKLDEKYIADWNILLDIKILLKTIQVVLQRKGSK